MFSLILDACHYGYPPNIAEGTFDCEALETPASSPPDPENSFLFWMFRVHQTVAASFPGPLGIHKTLSAVENTDAIVRELIAQIPPELSIPLDYNPVADSPVEIVRRYSIACLTQGHLLTLHRPYASISDTSKRAAVTAAWNLVEYQKQLMAISDQLEAFAWYIEEFIDPHLFRGTALLGVMLSREPQSLLADAIVRQVKVCATEAQRKSSRRREFWKTSNVFRAIHKKLTEGNETSGVGPSVPQVPSVSQEGSSDERGWGMEEVLTESGFRWDEYLVDMVLNTDQETI
jgi:hypothetical protein